MPRVLVFAALAVVSLSLVDCRHAARLHPLPIGERYDEPDQAEAYFRMKRGLVDGDNLQERYNAARAQMEGARQRLGKGTPTEIAPGAWTFLGPGNIGGRTRALAIDANRPNVMYAGGISGGIWKSENGGASWSPVSESLSNLAISSLVIDPTDSRTIYAGTGEGYFREDVRGTALPIRGDGIYVSHDTGGTWSRLTPAGSADFQWVNKVAVSRADANRVYAATRSGVWISANRGATWSKSLPVTVKGGCLDVALINNGDGSDTALASCGIFEKATIYRSTNSGSDSWTAVYSEPNMGRTSLAVSPSNPSIVYALSASNESGNFNQGLLAVFRSDNRGAAGTWRAQVRNTSTDRVSSLLLDNLIAAADDVCEDGEVQFVGMGWHCNVIAVDPVDPERVWAAGVDLFRSDDGGATWKVASYWWADSKTPSFSHADHHSIVFPPGYDGAANQTMYVTNDGGIFRTDNARAELTPGIAAACNVEASAVKFVSLNHNYGVTQFYHGLPFPNGASWVGGAQDNGSPMGTTAGGIDQWQMLFGGDGGFVAIDPINPGIVYVEFQNANIGKSVNGGQSFRGANSGLNDQFLFITPFLLDPLNSNRLWTGGTRMFRTDNGADSWTPSSAHMTSGQVSAIALATNRDRVYAGTSTGWIAKADPASTTNGASVWPSVKPRDGFVSSITVDPSNFDVAYATYGGFGGTHVWKTTDGGAHWSALDGSDAGVIPDIPVHSLAIDPQFPTRFFLGTDLGIFISLDAGAHWTHDTSFPDVITEFVTVGAGARGPALYAFTHGRGAWRVELTAAARRRSAAR